MQKTLLEIARNWFQFDNNDAKDTRLMSFWCLDFWLWASFFDCVCLFTAFYYITFNMVTPDKFHLRRITILQISVVQMAYFGSECLLFNLQTKRMKYGLIVKPPSSVYLTYFENLKLLLFETCHTSFPWFYFILLFC